MAKVVILGAGITGLSIAFHLKSDYFLAEKTSKIGGLCGSLEKNGFLFDYSEHFFRAPDKNIERFYKNLLGENIFSQTLISAIFFKNDYIPYPFQENLRQLSPPELRKCAKSLILNYISRSPDKTQFNSFEDFIKFQYGPYISEEFMIPYNEKIWCIPPSKLSTTWFLDPNFIPAFGLDEIIDSILPRIEKKSAKQQIRWYPLRGGAQAFGNAFLPHISNMHLNLEAKEINVQDKMVTFNDGSSQNYSTLVSTIPLINLLKIIKGIPKEISNLSSELQYNSVYCLNFGLQHKVKHKYHWVYFPQKEVPFARLFFSSNFSVNNAPPGKGTCSALTTYLPGADFDAKQFEKKTLQILCDLNLLKDDSEIIEKVPFNIQYGFAIPLLNLSTKIQTIKAYLENHNIFSIGRYGDWKYSGTEHAIEDGKRMAQKVAGNEDL